MLDLVGRARAVRSSAAVDSAFRSYKAQARGYVYFFFDRPDTGNRTLVKADQVALDVYWQAPNSTKQVIVGQRDQQMLPTDIRYHLDHLTVVQDDFGDSISMGDGDEVEAVPHPVGPGSDGVYDFLLADSLSISYAGGAEEIRVYQVRVRPRDFERPGFVGTVFLDRATAAIVRMSFSFTPASYVDPYVDYIRISLDNSLWMGRHWLPYRQEVEIRREIPLLDVMAGSVIRGRFEIRGYDFDVALPLSLFAGGRVSTASPAARAAFPFERGLLDDIEEEGLDLSPSLEEVRTEVAQVVQDQVVSGLDPFRLYFAAVSEAARYNRAEGLRLGGGFTLRPAESLMMRVSGGYAFGRERASGAVSTTLSPGRVVPTLDLYWDALGDVGGYLGASTLENTISAVSGKKDYTDPFFKRGAALTLGGADPAGPAVTFRWEEHRSARDVVSDDLADTDFRPVRTIDEGALGAVSVHAPVTLPGGGAASLTGDVGRLETRTFGSLSGEALWEIRALDHPWRAELSLGAGAITDDAPAQNLFLLGGRWTLPGHDYRSFAGDRYWLLKGEATWSVYAPYVGVRAIGAVGATYLGSRSLPADWMVQNSDGLRGSIGAGLSLGWDAMRVDIAHGVRGGGWEALFSVARQFRDWL
ncbi:MAG: hypothetical protein EXR91_02455 [Gemmatimonadetes bacterium]|nr:hypothetical protein [Gemmatimonadota bacterium]